MRKTEPKVKAATGGAGAAAVLVWLIEHYLFHDAASVGVDALLQVLAPALVAFAAGWLAKHHPDGLPVEQTRAVDPPADDGPAPIGTIRFGSNLTPEQEDTLRKQWDAVRDNPARVINNPEGK